MILNGAFAPGERITESALATALGVSRTPVCVALSVLELEGLVSSAPNRGAIWIAHTVTRPGWSGAEVTDCPSLPGTLGSECCEDAAGRGAHGEADADPTGDLGCPTAASQAPGPRDLIAPIVELAREEHIRRFDDRPHEILGAHVISGAGGLEPTKSSPPSTRIVLPVIHEVSGTASATMHRATSSVVVSRP